MLNLATPPDRPRPALLASIGIHMMAVSAFGLSPLLAFPGTPGWEGEVWVVTQPNLSVPRDVKTVDLRNLPSEPASSSGARGGLPAARPEGRPAGPASPVLQPGSIQEDLPYPTDTEPTWGSGIPGGDEEGTTDETGPGSGGMPGGSPIDVRAGVVPPDIVLPVPLETPPPHYPDLARIARATGSVVLSATIATDGRVVEVEVEPGANPLLAPAAVEAVSRWRYVPARIGSRQVAVILRVTLTFRLL